MHKYIKIISCFLILFLSVLATNNVYSQTIVIRTQAGKDSAGFTGTATQASKAKITQPSGVAVDQKGNLYFTNDSMHVVQKVTPNGNLSIYAGNGIRGFAGDGGPATSANLNYPLGLTCDNYGNLYIVDNNNSAIRKVDTNGIITSIAGQGGVFGWGFAGDGGPATSALINGGQNIAFDKHGNMYIADGNLRVRKINTSGIISTVVGSGAATTLPGYGNGGPATAAAFGSLTGIAVDTFDNIYVSDMANNVIRKIKPNDTIYAYAGTGVAGYSGDNGIATAAKLNSPISIIADVSGNLYVADRGNNRIRIISPTDSIKTYAGTGTAGYSGEGGVPTAAALKTPNALCLNSARNLFISDYSNYVIREILPLDTITITSNAGNNIHDTICFGKPVTFTATIKNGGYGDTVRWVKGSTTIGTSVVVGNTILNSTVFTTTNINNNDTIKCILYAPGGSTQVLSSNKIVFTVIASPSTIFGSPTVCYGYTDSLYDTVTGGTWSSKNNLVATISATGMLTPVSIGTDTIMYSTANGCSVSQVITVNPNPLPITGTLNVCVGSNTTLTDIDTGGIWKCDNASIATIDASGVLNGVSSGNTIITYTLPTSCYTISAITINPLPNAISGATSFCTRTNITLVDTTTGGVWGTSSPNVLVSPTGVVSGISQGIANISYALPTGCASVITDTVLPSPGTISNSTSGFSTICFGTSVLLTDTTSGGTWSTNKPLVATISASGLLTGVSNDTAIISYTTPNGCFSSLEVIVDSIPLPISGNTSVCVASTTTLFNPAGTGKWSILNSNASIDSLTGVVSGLVAGNDTVEYTIGTGCFNSVAIVVNPIPNNITGIDSVCVGTMSTLGNTTTGGLWSTSDSAVSGINSLGDVTGLRAGLDTISYTLPTGCKTSIQFVVKSTPLALTMNPAVCMGSSITLTDSIAGGIWSASNSNLVINSGTGEIVPAFIGLDTISYTLLTTSCSMSFVATVNPTPVNITGTPVICAGYSAMLADSTPSGMWISADTSIAKIISPGTIAGISAGSTSINYQLSTGCLATVVFTVNPLPVNIQGTDSVCYFATTNLTDSTLGGVWSLSSSTVASVDSFTGVVMGLAPGLDTMYYTLTATGCHISKTIKVNPNPAVISGFTSFCQGIPTSFTDVDGGGTWASSNATAVTVNASGVVTGILPDTATIIYTLPTTCFTSLPISINPTPKPIMGADSVCTGTPAAFMDSTMGGEWISSTPTVATVDTAGMLTGIIQGKDTLVYRNAITGCLTTKIITVNASPMPITGPSRICVGDTILVNDATAGGVYAGNNPSILLVVNSSTGKLAGIAPDTTSISYSIPNGCSSHLLITVDSLAKPIAGNGLLCQGLTLQLSDSTTGGTWLNVTSSIASIDTNGLVYGLMAGTDTVKYKLFNGCSVTAILTVNPTPSAIQGNNIICIGVSTPLTDSLTGGTWSLTNSSATITSTGIVTGVSTSIDTVVYNVNGCKTATTITVNPIPYVPTITLTSSASVCSNTMYQNFGTNAPSSGVNYSWSATNATVWAHGTGNQYCLVNFTTPGNAIVSLSANYAGYSCANTSTFLVTVSNDISENMDIIYLEHNFYCLRNDVSEYQWGYDNIDTLDPTILTTETYQNYYNPSPDFTHNLYWVKTTINGCTQKTYYSVPTAISNQSKNNSGSIKIYPNPAVSGSFTVELPELATNGSVNIIDVMGKQIAAQTIISGNNKIMFNLNNIAHGTYLVRVITKSKIYNGLVEIQ